MTNPWRRLGASAAVVLAGILLPVMPASADCPGGVPVGGQAGNTICGPSASPSPSPSPSQSSTPKPSSSPKPKPKPSSSRSSTPTPAPTPTRTQADEPAPPLDTPAPSGPPVQYPGFDSVPPGTSLPPYEPADGGVWEDDIDFEEFGRGEDRSGIPGYDPSASGLAAAPSDGASASPALRIFVVLAGAAGLAFLLVRARVRRWMIGI